MNLKCDAETATKLCDLYNTSTGTHTVTVANSNHPSQTIISGSKLNLLQFRFVFSKQLLCILTNCIFNLVNSSNQIHKLKIPYCSQLPTLSTAL